MMGIENYLNMIVGMGCILIMILCITYYLRNSGHGACNPDKTFNYRNLVLIIIMFSITGIAANRFFSFHNDYAYITVRTFVTMATGLVGGPLAGLSVGVITGIDRFSMGGATAFPCAMDAVVAGLVGGILWYYAGRSFPKLSVAVIAAFLMEILHMGMVWFLSSDMYIGHAVVNEIFLIQVDLNMFCMIVFGLVYLTKVRHGSIE